MNVTNKRFIAHLDMKFLSRHIISALLISTLLLAMPSCDDRITLPSNLGYTRPDLPLTECKLSFEVEAFLEGNVEDLSRSDAAFDEEETTSADEKYIKDLWIFQYNAANDSLINIPEYHEISDQSDLLYLSALLVDGVESNIYVVANLHRSTWASNAQSFATLQHLLNQELITPDVILASELAGNGIPMVGHRDNVTVDASEAEPIVVPVKRIYAKIKVSLGDVLDNFTITALEVSGIPYYGTIKPLIGDDEKMAYDYPSSAYFITHAMTSVMSKVGNWYTMYIPENIQGENQNNQYYPEYKYEDAPANALKVVFHMRHFDEEGAYDNVTYIVYPGKNNYNNFNIERNCVYRILCDILVPTSDVSVPSANSFVVQPGDLMRFEPYVRTEVGGYSYDGDGYSIEDWINPDDEDKAIDKVAILWQTEQCIGDNSAGNLVWYNATTQKIYVKTNPDTDGNAVIAAYNKADEIIWSWHIWSTYEDPANVGESERYQTYAWDHNGIYADQERVPGYSIMQCNLGALSETPDESAYWRTYGLWYQWGRKDPLPSSHDDKWDSSNPKTKDWSEIGYKLYDNSHSEVDISTTGETYFRAIDGQVIKEQYGGEWEAVRYAVQHPTHYLCGANKASTTDDYSLTESECHSVGDWYPHHDHKLWGALVPDSVSGNMMWFHYGTFSKNADTVENVNLYDNYGTKSIFDPCPKGWRVASVTLWLGLTSTGYNPTSKDEINYERSNVVNGGLWIYLREFRSGTKSYFPTPGSLFAKGTIHRVGICGNYHTASSMLSNHVNCMHIHDSGSDFAIFEYQYYRYRIKSTAGPIRCVRDTR